MNSRCLSTQLIIASSCGGGLSFAGAAGRTRRRRQLRGPSSVRGQGRASSAPPSGCCGRGGSSQRLWRRRGAPAASPGSSRWCPPAGGDGGVRSEWRTRENSNNNKSKLWTSDLDRWKKKEKGITRASRRGIDHPLEHPPCPCSRQWNCPCRDRGSSCRRRGRREARPPADRGGGKLVCEKETFSRSIYSVELFRL